MLPVSSGADTVVGHSHNGVLDHDAYMKTPRANFDEIRAFLNKAGYTNNLKTNATLLPSGIILNHPSPGNQGNSAACVGWSVGYALMSTLNMEFPIANIDSLRSGWFINQVDTGGATAILSKTACR